MLILSDIEDLCNSPESIDGERELDLELIKRQMDVISPDGSAIGRWVSAMAGATGTKLEIGFGAATGIANSYIKTIEGMRSKR